MSTDVVVGRPAVAAAAGTAPRRTVTTASIRSVVASYVHYRSSLSSRRISSDSRRSDNVVDEDQIDGLISDDVDNRVTTNLPPGVEQTVRLLAKEFEQRYEQASWGCEFLFTSLRSGYDYQSASGRRAVERSAVKRYMLRSLHPIEVVGIITKKKEEVLMILRKLTQNCLQAFLCIFAQTMLYPVRLCYLTLL